MSDYEYDPALDQYDEQDYSEQQIEEEEKKQKQEQNQEEQQGQEDQDGQDDQYGQDEDYDDYDDQDDQYYDDIDKSVEEQIKRQQIEQNYFSENDEYWLTDDIKTSTMTLISLSNHQNEQIKQLMSYCNRLISNLQKYFPIMDESISDINDYQITRSYNNDFIMYLQKLDAKLFRLQIFYSNDMLFGRYFSEIDQSDLKDEFYQINNLQIQIKKQFAVLNTMQIEQFTITEIQKYYYDIDTNQLKLLTILMEQVQQFVNDYDDTLQLIRSYYSKKTEQQYKQLQKYIDRTLFFGYKVEYKQQTDQSIKQQLSNLKIKINMMNQINENKNNSVKYLINDNNQLQKITINQNVIQKQNILNDDEQDKQDDQDDQVEYEYFINKKRQTDKGIVVQYVQSNKNIQSGQRDSQVYNKLDEILKKQLEEEDDDDDLDEIDLQNILKKQQFQKQQQMIQYYQNDEQLQKIHEQQSLIINSSVSNDYDDFRLQQWNNYIQNEQYMFDQYRWQQFVQQIEQQYNINNNDKPYLQSIQEYAFNQYEKIFLYQQSNIGLMDICNSYVQHLNNGLQKIVQQNKLREMVSIKISIQPLVQMNQQQQQQNGSEQQEQCIISCVQYVSGIIKQRLDIFNNKRYCRQNVIIQGEGGSGKTFCISQIIKKLKSKVSCNIGVYTLTHIAKLNFQQMFDNGGKQLFTINTLAHLFYIGRQKYGQKQSDDFINFKLIKQLITQLQNFDLVVIEEYSQITMSQYLLIKYICSLLVIPIIFLGDKYQGLTPIEKLEFFNIDDVSSLMTKMKKQSQYISHFLITYFLDYNEFMNGSQFHQFKQQFRQNGNMYKISKAIRDKIINKQKLNYNDTYKIFKQYTDEQDKSVQKCVNIVEQVQFFDLLITFNIQKSQDYQKKIFQRYYGGGYLNEYQLIMNNMINCLKNIVNQYSKYGEQLDKQQIIDCFKPIYNHGQQHLKQKYFGYAFTSQYQTVNLYNGKNILLVPIGLTIYDDDSYKKLILPDHINEIIQQKNQKNNVFQKIPKVFQYYVKIQQKQQQQQQLQQSSKYLYYFADNLNNVNLQQYQNDAKNNWTQIDNSQMNFDNIVIHCLPIELNVDSWEIQEQQLQEIVYDTVMDVLQYNRFMYFDVYRQNPFENKIIGFSTIKNTLIIKQLIDDLEYYYKNTRLNKTQDDIKIQQYLEQFIDQLITLQDSNELLSYSSTNEFTKQTLTLRLMQVCNVQKLQGTNRQQTFIKLKEFESDHFQSIRQLYVAVTRSKKQLNYDDGPY